MNTIIFKLITTLILLSIFISLFSCCKSLIPPDDKLTLTRENYDGNELKIDGYYYRLDYTKAEGYYDTYFFYKNGIVLYPGTISESTLNKFIEYLQNFDKSKNNYKSSWGVFLITDSIIKFEKWYPSSAFEPTPTYIREGKILNDTTFQITKTYRGNGSELKVVDEIYHFKKFSPKPDSTNVFIK